MHYQKLRADKIFDGNTFQENKVLLLEPDGTIAGLIAAEEAGDEIKVYNGILTPGFINCHCHLELSHLKNVIPPHTGLIEFLCSVVTKRGFPADFIQQEIEKAEKEMEEKGIVAVGDIGNTADTASIKSSSRIRWQNFVEVLSFTDAKAAENIDYYQQVATQMENALKNNATPHRTSLVPHAPYSISPQTFQRINQLTANQIISIHNQEHPAEDVLYQTGGGDYLKLFKIFGMDASPFPVTGKTSIRSVLPYFNNGQTVLLVHNTCMTEPDISWANEYAAANDIQLVYCICINANLYIENKCPPLDLFIKHNCRMVLGTDSYSSNWQLNMAKEIAAIQKHFPQLPVETVLQWATANGARALQWSDALGSFEKGKKPGVVLWNAEEAVSKRIC